MERIAIVGPSECGKTSLAMTLANQYVAHGIPVLACDFLEARWPAKYLTTDPVAFIAFAQRAWGCALFIDEPGKRVRKAKNSEWLFTSSRHREHDLVCSMHDGIALSPESRHQFTALCIFASHPDVCEAWEYEFNDPALRRAASLPRYSFLLKRRFEPVRELWLTAEQASAVSANVKGKRLSLPVTGAERLVNTPVTGAERPVRGG